MDSVENPAAIMVAAFKTWHPEYSVTVRFDVPDSEGSRLPPDAVSFAFADGDTGFFIVLNCNEPMRELMASLSRALVQFHAILVGGNADDYLQEFCDRCCAMENALSRADELASMSANGTTH